MNTFEGQPVQQSPGDGVAPADGCATDRLRSRLKEMEQRERELLAVNSIAHVVANSPEISDIVEQALERLIDVTELEAGAVFLLNEAGNELSRVGCVGFSEQYRRRIREVKMGDQLIGRVAKDRQPIIVEDISKDRRITNIVIQREGIRSWAGVPLMSKDRLLGVINVVTREFRRFESSDLDLLNAVASQLAVAIDNAQLFEKSARLAVMEDRNWLAREIHDTLAQGLVALTLQLELALTQLGTANNADAVEPSLRKALDLARENLDEARRSVVNLRGDRIAQVGLANAVSNLVETFARETETQVHAAISKRLGALPINLEEGLYRIAQEALTNIRKHASAGVVRVSLQRRRGNIQLMVRDDGEGFNPLVKPPDGHFGLVGMGERASVLGGRLDVQSRPGHGAVIQAVVPIRSSPMGTMAHD